MDGAPKGHNERRSSRHAALLRGLLPVLLFAAVSFSVPAAADTVSVETGHGFHHSQHSECLFLRYQIKGFELLGYDTYYEAFVGGWNGRNRNEAAALSLGIKLPWHADDWFFGSAGLGGVKRSTDNLGVRFLVTFHVGYTKKLDGLNLTAAYSHFSTGKYFLGWEGPNYGENFYTLQAGWEF